MRFFALATDYDGTLATDGIVLPATISALERFLETGRKLILVTGRELEDLKTTFDRLDLFSVAVLENGAVLYFPATKQLKVLAPPPPPEFVERLRRKGVSGISEGKTIVATWVPHEREVLEAIREMNLELQLIFNKGAVMVLPTGVNKATGLRAALDELGLSRHNVVGVGDAENDHSFLRLCHCSVAVKNALPAVKDTVSIVTEADHGAGVEEIIDALLKNDLSGRFTPPPESMILLGTALTPGEGAGNEVHIHIPHFARNILIAGSSGGGKTTFVTSFLEQLIEKDFQFCLVDPEGDYETMEGAIALGSKEDAPRVDELLQLLAKPHQNVVIGLTGIGIEDRPAFFLSLLPQLQELRARTGRPHWIVVDEAHHVLPAAWQHAKLTIPSEMSRMLFVTLSPKSLLESVVKPVDAVIAVGDEAPAVFGEFAEIENLPQPHIPEWTPERGTALLWSPRDGKDPVALRSIPTTTQRRRHRRKYAEGALLPDDCFYFRGPEGKLNLKAQNLIVFLQMAQGVDDETWLYHLRRGDYSDWMRKNIKDSELAEAAALVENQHNLSASESRARIKQEIEDRYTAPA